MATEIARSMVRCDDCNGTGSEEPNCYLCEGNRYVSTAKAIAEGFSKTEFDEDEDGEARCPCCGGESCEVCEGSGQIDDSLSAQQEDRVLICALADGRMMPPLFRPDWQGNLYCDRESLLSSSAAARMSEQGRLFRVTYLAFGDKISLQGDGVQEAKAAWRRHRGRWKEWIKGERERRARRLEAAPTAHDAHPAEGGRHDDRR